MSTPRDIGYKAIAASISDIAAMAASPRYALCALTLSDDVDAGWTMELFGGMREASDELNCDRPFGMLQSLKHFFLRCLLHLQPEQFSQVPRDPRRHFL